jgi:hypothetical protein
MNPCVGGRVVVVTTNNMALDGGEWSASLYGRFASSKSPLFPLNIRASEPQSQNGGFGEEKNLCHMLRIERVLLVAQPQSWSVMRLRYPLVQSASRILQK